MGAMYGDFRGFLYEAPALSMPKPRRSYEEDRNELTSSFEARFEDLSLELN
jgi:hypothetical protein